MSEAIHAQFWNDQFETLITEIARQATVAHVPLANPGIVEAVLRNDEATCGSSNSLRRLTFVGLLPLAGEAIDRFNALHSISHQRGFLYKPVINHWATALGRILKKKYPVLRILKKNFSFIPTIDIDSAWQFREKGFIRSAGGFLRSAYHGDFSDLYLRTRVLLKVASDPFDTYEEQLRILKEFGLHPIYFVLFGEYGLNDKNIPVNVHLSGLLQSSAEWDARNGDPVDFNAWMRAGATAGWLGIVSSAYGQPILPFLQGAMNGWAVDRQVAMDTWRYGYTPHVAWVPERVWLTPGQYPGSGVIDWSGSWWQANGIDAVILDARTEAGETDQLWFDNATGLLLAIDSTETFANGVAQRVRYQYEDYKKVDGIPVPHRMRYESPRLIWVVTRQVALNVPVDDSAFQPPDQKE